MEAAVREVFTTFTALQHELFGDDVSRWQRLGLVAAVSCVASASQQRCMYWRVDASAVHSISSSAVVSSGVKPVLEQLLVAASMHLTTFVDAGIPERWEAAVRVVQDDWKRGAVFGEGVWMVPWRDFVTLAEHSLCMVGEAETLDFARHVEKIGALLVLGGGVDGEVSGGVGDGDGKLPHRWIVCMLHDAELEARMLLPSREMVRVQVARVSGTGGANGTQSVPRRKTLRV
jgi:hypothetical protein